MRSNAGFFSNGWREITLRFARGLMALLALSILAVTLASAFRFQEYALAHLDQDDFNTPNAEWTAGETQAALKELGWPSTTIAWWGYVRGVIGLLTVYPVLFLMLWRSPGGWFGVYVAFVFALIGALGGAALLPFVDNSPAVRILNTVIGGMGWQLFFVLFFFFPNGRPVPRWTRWLVGLWFGWMALQVWVEYQPANPLAMAINDASSPLAFGMVLTALGSQYYRYFRVSNALERQQTRLVILALVVILGIVMVGIPLGFHSPDPQRLGSELVVALIQWTFFGLSFTLVPLAIGVSILRYRLWDVDVIVRRTLVYSALTGILALVFFGGVTVLQGIFSTVTGEQSSLAIALSTLAIAALFNPLRKRIQEFIDRRFYRQKYNAEQALAEFAAAARSETNLEALTSQVIGIVEKTMQPENVSIWMKKEGEGKAGGLIR